MTHKLVKNRFFLAAMLLAWLVCPFAASLYGPYSLPLADIWEVFKNPFSGGDDPAWLIVAEIRLARAFTALFCGGALAMAGVALQGVLRNPLAEPFTLGISAGAACGASLAIAFAAAEGMAHTALISSCSLAGSIAALAASLFLGRGRGAFERESVILAGIAVAAFLGSIVALVKALNEESVTSIVFWIMGSLQGRSWGEMPMLLGLLIPGALLCAAGWRDLDALALGDERAATLGINPGPTRLRLLCGASLMTAGCVAVCGVIGFVGLVAPHILRALLGPAHGPLLLASFLFGGMFLLGCDCLARAALNGGQELPVGVVTALTGGPFFAFLIWRRQNDSAASSR